MNAHRGDVEIKMEDKTFTMRPTYEAIVLIEQRTGESLTTLMRKAMTVDLSLSEMAQIVSAGLNAAGENGATPKKLAEMIFNTGIPEVAAPIADFLANALRGGEPVGEPKATETK